ncbi:MAG TPA: NBR1-Ig-like domain-containing protein, partial [Anaerolineales bacterium]|nr:NBR1-Ig-like domain-containing protein [Anaerolineales bacterium]
YKLAFSEGEPMAPPGTSVPLPALKPGKEGEVTVNLTAPSLAGRYRSVWKARGPDGEFFPFEMYAEIVVASARQDGALFLEDLTVPDGTEVAPGEIFLKRWKVRNSGTTTWGSGYSLAFFGDSQMGSPDALPVPAAKPGETAEISVSLRAPAEPGSHQSTWRLRNPSGQFIGDALFAMINVVRRAADPALIDLMGYVDDVTFADGTQVRPGQRMEKVWRVRNLGTSSWGQGYILVFSSGDRMGGPESIPLPQTAPGQTADLRLTLTAPTAPGLHRSVWKARRPDGQIFEHEMFAEIEVVRELVAGDLVDGARFVRDVTITSGSVRRAGESALKMWQVRNTGSSTWGSGYKIVFSSGHPIDAAPEAVPPAAPGAEVNLSVRLTMPLNPGSYESAWRLQNAKGEAFGDELPLQVILPSPIPPSNQRHGGALISYETFQPGSRVRPGEAIQAILRVRNTGNTTWGSGYSLVHVDGDRLGGSESQPLPACSPGMTVRLALGLKMPDAEGDYRGVWRLRSPDGKLFGSKMPIELAVR